MNKNENADRNGASEGRLLQAATTTPVTAITIITPTPLQPCATPSAA